MSNCNCGGCGCSVCQPANVVFHAACTDPGVATFGAHLNVLDQNFCERRLANVAGFVVIQSTPNGTQVTATATPQIQLSSFGVISGGTIGNLVVQGTDNGLYSLVPPNTSGLYLSTNGSGQFVLSPLPPSTVPDPLAVTTANVTNLTATNFTLTAGMIASGLGTGTIVSTLGVDAGGNVIKGTASSTGVQAAMFYESASFPSVAPTPNQNAAAGAILVIGNGIYDSGGTIITVTNSQTLTVASAGKYILSWEGQVAYTGGGTGTPSIQLLLNGVIVNYGNARPGISTTTDRVAFCSGVHARDLVAGDTLQFQLAGSSGANTHVYELRMVAQRFGG